MDQTVQGRLLVVTLRSHACLLAVQSLHVSVECVKLKSSCLRGYHKNIDVIT